MEHATYDWFSRQPEYLEVNRQFIDSITPLLNGVECVVDVACGTGVMTQLLYSAMNSLHSPSRRQHPRDAAAGNLKLYAIDVSSESLQAARENLSLLTSTSDESPTYNLDPVFSCAPGDKLPIGNEVADIVLMGNAIHLMSPKESFLKEAHRVLKPGGILAFNTCFYEGGTVEGTLHFYRDWMKGALGILKSQNGNQRKGPAPGEARPAFSNPWLRPQEYQELLLGYGFEVRSLRERRQTLSRECLQAIAAYAEFADAFLHRYDPAQAVQALHRALDPALASSGGSTISRSWLEIVGVSRASHSAPN